MEENQIYSKEYIKWVQQSKMKPLTNTQHKFAEWLLSEDNAKVISQIGDLNDIFISVRKFLKK